MVGCPLKGLWKKERKLKTGLRQIRKRDNINIRTDEYMRHSLSAISENNLEKEKGSWWLKQLGNCMWVFNGSQKEVTHFYNITAPQCFVDVCLCVWTFSWSKSVSSARGEGCTVHQEELLSSERPLLRIPSVETHYKYLQVFSLALTEDNSPHVINARGIVHVLFFHLKMNMVHSKNILY